MGLFSPWFLAGLAALGLPLWLHLLRKFKRAPRPFSSLMFFERRIQSSSKHRRLRYIRLLLLRVALISLLCLLFANPFVNRASSAIAARKLTVIAIDHSFSMRYQNRLADAKSQAMQLMNSLPSRQAVQIVALDSHAVAIKDPISSIEATDEASSYGEFSRALRVLEQTTALQLDVHLFTDVQQTSMPTAFTDLQMGPHTSLTIHKIGGENSPNWTVQSVSVPSRTFGAATVRLIAGVAGWQTPQTRKKLFVFLDDRVVATKEIEVPASGRCEMEFNDLVVPYGLHRGEVRLQPNDDLPRDDSFPFSIERSDPRKVLFLYGPGRSADSLFYKSALDASPADGLRVDAKEIDQSSNINLSQYAFVVLNNPGELDVLMKDRLSNYVLKGGALFIAVGLATEKAGSIPITGNKILGTTPIQGSDKFDNVQFVATPRIALDAGDRLIDRFADGTPLQFEKKIGEGRILVFASTLDNSTSDLPMHASFVPFVASSGAYLAGGEVDSSSVLVGSAVPLRQSTAQSATADVIGPEGKHELELSDATRLMSFNPAREGFYDVRRANGSRVLLAAHADRRESNLTKVPSDVLDLWRNTSSGGMAGPEAAPSNIQIPFSLWRYILTLVLIAAIVESVFAARYLSEDREST